MELPKIAYVDDPIISKKERKQYEPVQPIPLWNEELARHFTIKASENPLELRRLEVNIESVRTEIYQMKEQQKHHQQQIKMDEQNNFTRLEIIIKSLRTEVNQMKEQQKHHQQQIKKDKRNNFTRLEIIIKSLRTEVNQMKEQQKHHQQQIKKDKRNKSTPVLVVRTFTDDDIQKIISTAIFFPAPKNKLGSPRNYEEVRVEDKFILNKLYIKGFEDWKFDEAYLFNFIFDFMDLRRGRIIRPLNVSDIIKKTLREIGTKHFYDLQFICNQIHMIFDCVLSELEDDDGDSEKLPTSVLNLYANF
nr:MAG: hypothetical protein [Porcellio scaber clopovirus]